MFFSPGSGRQEFLEALKKVERVRVGICSLEFHVHGSRE